MKFEIDVLQWSDDPSTGLGKKKFLGKIVAFPTICYVFLYWKIQNFPLNGHISLEGGS